ncbi:hypothetical protein XALC_1368 [Xanthomonas albilineans GPE PC73]|uniref:Uncharacterized protein n=1 Tax=Xanthomonas albilineans (strain GPE PC73 / CFBP 7063) TaxID=380358 RepID=D2UD94_XANAP|nr:hypothetical protein XALC_1368 [Xanthomonas albilineans GPE PC73]
MQATCLDFGQCWWIEFWSCHHRQGAHGDQGSVAETNSFGALLMKEMGDDVGSTCSPDVCLDGASFDAAWIK